MTRRGGEGGTVAEEAVGLYRELAATDPATYEPELGLVLYTWSQELAGDTPTRPTWR